MSRFTLLILFSIMCLGPATAIAQDKPETHYDAELAKSLGADERGMRSYVLVVLKTGPTKVPSGEKRTQMFAGHMANIQRLADEGILAFAGPLDGVDGWRGLFIFATPDIATAKTHVDTDPVIINGEMVAEYHVLYGSAGLMMMNEISRKISKESPSRTEESNMSNSPHTHHAIDYIEFTVTDMALAKGFYEAAFGWAFNDYGPAYAGIQKQQGGEAGGLRLEPETTAGGPLVILYSTDLEASLASVRAAGGQITQDPFEFPGGRRFHFKDPSGNQLAVWSDE